MIDVQHLVHTHTHTIHTVNSRDLSTLIFSFHLTYDGLSLNTQVKNRASIRASLHLHTVPHQLPGLLYYILA